MNINHERGRRISKLSGATLSALTLSMGLATAAQAAPILVDFSNSDDNSFGTTPGNVNNFNKPHDFDFDDGGNPFPFTLFSDLIDDDGNSTGVSLVATDGEDGPAGETFTGENETGFPDETVGDAFFFIDNYDSPVAFQYENLAPNTSYDLTVLSLIDNQSSDNGTTVSQGVDTAEPGSDGLVEFESVQPDSNGVIAFTVSDGDSGDPAFYNGFELVAVPEPGSLALLGLGGLLMLGRGVGPSK